MTQGENPTNAMQDHMWESLKAEGGTVMDGNVVNHPAHYQLENGMEAIDIIKGTLGDRGYKAFCRGNTLKYLLRAGKKGLITDDLKKAAWYLDAEVKAYEEADD